MNNELLEQNAWGGTAISTRGDTEEWVRQTCVRNGLNIVNSALKLRDKLNNLSRRASFFFGEVINENAACWDSRHLNGKTELKAYG